MKKLLFLISLIVLVVASQAQQIPQKPNPPRLVNDLAEVLTPDQEQTLETKLYRYDDSTSNQIVVLTIKTLNGRSIDDYALEVLREWGVGNKKTNNGVVIVAAIKEQKVWISVGYGLEGVITDLIAQNIIDEYIIPNFKEQNYYRGFDQAADALIKAAQGRYKAPENYRKKGKSPKSISTIVIMIILLIFFISRRGGGRGGGMMSRRGYRGSSVPPIWWFPTGGGGFGGGGGGGGFGGGGFGGFGGGGGGGGGAGGSW